MFFTAEMRYLQIVVLEKDFQKTIDLLADFGWLEIKRNAEEKKEKFQETNEILNRVEDKISKIINFLDITKSEGKGLLKDISEIDNYFSNLLEIINPYIEKINNLMERKKVLESGLTELEPFKELRITKKELQDFNFLFFKVGSLTRKDFIDLMNNMQNRLLYTELSKDFYLFFTSKKGRWTLESELKKLNFKEKEIPFENDILPAEVFKSLQKQMDDVEKELKEIESYRNEIIKKERVKINFFIESFNLQQVYQDIHQNISHSGSISIIEGWVLKRNLPDITKKIQTELGNRISLICYKPEELSDVKDKKLKVPVIMENFWIFKPFEELIFNYGAPLYGSVDPTILFAVSFMLLFGFMFGDVGQGLVILLVGLYLKFTKIESLKKLKQLSSIFQYLGISSIIFGFIYGSIFCYEHVEFIFTPINKFLFGIDKPYLFNLDLKSGDINIAIKLVLITIGIGLIMNLLGILLNILNSFFHKKIKEVLFSRNGIAGFIFLSSIVIMYFLATLFKVSIPTFLLYIILVSVLLVVIKDPLYNILFNKRPIFHDGFGIWILYAFVEFLELVMITISNNLSFIRVAAFAVTHTLLSFIFLEIASILGKFGIIIVIIGNIIIIGLEGLVVSIQTIRLEYYEFFSKFFMQKGKKFIPFKIEKNKFKEIA